MRFGILKRKPTQVLMVAPAAGGRRLPLLGGSIASQEGVPFRRRRARCRSRVIRALPVVAQGGSACRNDLGLGDTWVYRSPKRPEIEVLPALEASRGAAAPAWLQQLHAVRDGLRVLRTIFRERFGRDARAGVVPDVRVPVPAEAAEG